MFYERDMLLAAIAGNAYAGYMSMGITLHVGGLIITGTVTSEQAYFEGIQDLLAQEGTIGTTLVANLFQNLNQADKSTSAPDDEIVNVPVLFLKDAVAYNENRPGLWLGWWRVPISAVVGWGWASPQELVVEEDGTDS